MASYGYQPAPHHGGRHGPRGGYAPQPVPSHGPAAPAGTFSPGTKIQVGGHRVVIQKYLSEGGFAHVYLVKLPKPVDGTDLAVLKRVAVPDKEALRHMRTEVETMKRLKGHRPIVTYIDSHASELRGGGYEVFLLMEFCDGGGLIDFMNTRLQHRLTEPEILHIFADIAEGVACMHYLKPALLHRDLKVENVLIVTRGSSRRFKVCDFGSSAPSTPAPTTVVECRLMDEDVQKHTTLQYRSPEMVDVYRKQPLNEKSDIWALGVLLYKLCYYTTPFEDQGQLAILNASFKYPSYPAFSDRLKKLIAWMLKESIDARPNIYQVLKEACAMQGRDVPISDIYTGKPQRGSSAPTKQPARSSPAKPAVGAVYSPPVEAKDKIPDITPMRRGRPAASPGPQKVDSTSKKVTDGDPFAALDTKSGRKAAHADELSSRFPTLDQFSLLHNKDSKFDFDSSTSPQTAQPPPDPRLAEKLADEAFASSRQSSAKPSPSMRPHSVTPTIHQHAMTTPPAERPPSKTPSAPPKSEVSVSRAASIIRSNPDLKAISSQSGSKYVSTGTMTADFPERPSSGQSHQRSASHLRSTTKDLEPSDDSLPIHARPPHLRQPSLSSRPSLEDQRRQVAQAPDPLGRLSTPVSRQRPASASFESSTLDFLREKEMAKAPRQQAPAAQYPSRHMSLHGSQNQTSKQQPDATSGQKQQDIGNLLLDIEDSDSSSRGRNDITRESDQVAAPVPKKLAGKFGDAFSRFEEAADPVRPGSGGARPKSPLNDAGRIDVSKIRQAEAPTYGRSDNALIDLDDDSMTPEMRREAERLKLEEEEQRVAAAQAEYRKLVASGGVKPTPGPKHIGASSIQSRVQSLLSEDQKPSNVQRTAHGYGKYTDEPTGGPKTAKTFPVIPRKPVSVKPKPDFSSSDAGQSPAAGRSATGSSSAPAMVPPKPTGSKPPPAPKKPTHLNSLPTGPRASSPVKQTQPQQLEQLIAQDLPGQPVLEMSSRDKEDYIEDFTKRFPSLSSIEMEARAKR